MSNLKRKSTVILALVGALVVATAAYAYWTGGGTGTGTAPTKTGAAPITAVQTTVITPMFPGDTAQTISGTFNNTNNDSVYVTVAITGVAKATGAPAGTCDASDYTLAGTAMTVNADVPKGANPTPGFTGATIKFNNKASNQDAWKGVHDRLAVQGPRGSARRAAPATSSARRSPAPTPCPSRASAARRADSSPAAPATSRRSEPRRATGSASARRQEPPLPTRGAPRTPASTAGE